MSDVTIIDDGASLEEPSYIHWGPVIAGAMTAAGVGFVLYGFATAIGLSVTSTAPTWRDASIGLVLLTGIYLIFAAIVSYGLGGYIAGRALYGVDAATDETEFRDGANGLVSWALATLITAVVAFGLAEASTRLAAPSAGAAGPAASTAGENLIAFDLDRLFRSDRPPQGDMAYARAEAARILLTANSHRGMQAQDHDYLARLVAQRTGLSAADATKRVDEVTAEARDNVARARRSAVILAFMAAAAALIGAAIAWAAATAGGRHRLGVGASHLWRWDTPTVEARRL